MNDTKKTGPLNPDRIVDPRSLPIATPSWRGDLPHLFKDGGTYFVTFCLADAVPARLKRRRRIEDAHEPLKVAEYFDIEPAVGSCILRRASVVSAVEEALLHFQGDRYALSAWCVMPNHVHVVVTPYSGQTLSKILHSWKSYSAHEINHLLNRTGKVWEKESFDHLVRHERAFVQFVEYTENNPVVAGLCREPDRWPYSSARFRVSVE